MREEPFVVKFLSVRNCYLYFSDYWIKILNDLCSFTSALKVNYKNGKHAHFSWSPQYLNVNDNSVVCVSATYAQKLGISEGEKVTITLLTHTLSVSRVYMTPVTSDDFEILAMNQDLLQAGLLDQIQIVWPGQSLVAWVGTSMYAALYVDSVEPECQVGRLQLMTEIIVNTPSENDMQGGKIGKGNNKENHQANIVNDNTSEEAEVEGEEEGEFESSNIQKTSSVVSFLWDSVQDISSRLWGKKECCNDVGGSGERSLTKVLLEKLKALEPLVYRVHPFKFVNEMTIDSQIFHPYNAYVHKINMHVPLLYSSKSLVVKLVPVSFSSKTNLSDNEEEKNYSGKEKESDANVCIYVKLCFIEDISSNLEDNVKQEIDQVFQDGGQKCIYISNVVQAALQVKIGARVRLELENVFQQSSAVSIEVSPISTTCSPKNLEFLWKNYMLNLCGEGDILLNSNGIIPVPSPGHSFQYILIKVIDPAVPYYLFTKNNLENCKVKVSVEKRRASIPKIEDENILQKEDYHSFSHLQKQISHGMTNLELTLGLVHVPWSIRKSIISVANVLIRGKPGSGSSSLARHLCNRFQKPPYYVHCVEIQCRNLKGKKVENLHRYLSQALGDCSLHQPSILLLQDLDALAAVSSEDQDPAQEGRYYTRVGEMLVDLLEDFQPLFQIAVVATALTSTKLNSALMAPRGQHTFLCVLDIPDITKDDRLNILGELIEKKVILKKSEIDLNSIAQKTDGYVVQDLVDLVEKAVFEAWKRKAVAGDFSDVGPSLQSRDLEKAFELTQPLALRGVELVQDAGLSWADIGGLDHAKKLLVEMLEWPVRFPELFSQAPLRLQSGLLLYGAPGTGKTLLAGAVAKECGLNFISVKGPELLSKYIGASEEAVRTVFQKAQSAKPCVLFFDEFDSLAPRRGHDSTGVTDRVVNQLLTQLDGVESLCSVWVLAATSRPDLLDPALLRPGRLDHAVLCPLPSEEDRLSILKSLSRKMVLAEDVNLAQLAQQSVGFTGADLQAVLYSAQLAAVEQMSPSSDSSLNPTSPEDPVELENLIEKNRPIHVTQAHLAAALKDTRPSLNSQEKQKYDIIYKNFEKSRPSTSRTVQEVTPLIQKVTLA